MTFRLRDALKWARLVATLGPLAPFGSLGALRRERGDEPVALGVRVEISPERSASGRLQAGLDRRRDGEAATCRRVTDEAVQQPAHLIDHLRRQLGQAFGLGRERNRRLACA
jgi:hypothetical protein